MFFLTVNYAQALHVPSVSRAFSIMCEKMHLFLYCLLNMRVSGGKMFN